MIRRYHFRIAWRSLGLALICLALAGCRLFPTSEDARTPWVHPLTPHAEPLTDALRPLGIAPQDIGFRRAYFDALGRDEFRSRLFDQYATQPLEIPYMLANVRQGALKECDSLHRALMGLTVKMDERVWRGMFGTFDFSEEEKKIEKSETPLVDALAQLAKERGGAMTDGRREKCRKAMTDLPRDVREAAALVVGGAVRACEWLDRAFADASDLEGEMGDKLIAYLAVEPDGSRPPGVELRLHRVDFAALCAGSQDLAMAVDKARKRLTDRKTTETFCVSWPTPLGDVLLRAGRGEGDAVVNTRTFVLIDLDGDDTYRFGGSADGPAAPVSVLIDAAGNDRYLAPGGTDKTTQPLVGAFGSGIRGYGYLLDLAGDDRYEAHSMAEGSGCLGVGALMDYGGKDAYEGVVHCQGAGSFGMGLLSDLGGDDDSYRGFMMSQGFGFTKGTGLLLDAGESNDRYELRNDEIRYPSSQAPETHNSSMGQGAGYGRRADVYDGRSWAGGYGLLVDEAGDDTYRAAVFAQGTAYWFGLGFLLDGAGNDDYQAHWYCQGGPAHYAVCALVDDAGDDSYSCDANVAQGGAHDWSIAWLVDKAGDDTYRSGELSLGTGNANGIGLFLDIAGDDRYVSIRKKINDAVGGARFNMRGSMREVFPNIGVFMDLGGCDDYTSFSLARNNATWTAPDKFPGLGLPVNWGAGVDTEAHGESPVRLEPYTKKEDSKK